MDWWHHGELSGGDTAYYAHGGHFLANITYFNHPQMLNTCFKAVTEFCYPYKYGKVEYCMYCGILKMDNLTHYELNCPYIYMNVT